MGKLKKCFCYKVTDCNTYPMSYDTGKIYIHSGYIKWWTYWPCHSYPSYSVVIATWTGLKVIRADLWPRSFLSVQGQ